MTTINAVRTVTFSGEEVPPFWHPEHTPWGKPSRFTFLFAPGSETPAILCVNTPSHGGMLPCREIYDRIPLDAQAYALRWGGLAASGIPWFEEDVCAAFVILAAPELFDDEATLWANVTARFARENKWL